MKTKGVSAIKGVGVKAPVKAAVKGVAMKSPAKAGVRSVAVKPAAKKAILVRARIEGLRAPVDAVPDFSEGNLQFWKARLLTHFGCAADNLVAESGAGTEMLGEILAAMKDGFKELILSQAYVDEPFSPREQFPKTEELRIVDEVFAELPHASHHCTT